jgi:hypothetical protein
MMGMESTMGKASRLAKGLVRVCSVGRLHHRQGLQIPLGHRHLQGMQWKCFNIALQSISLRMYAFSRLAKLFVRVCQVHARHDVLTDAGNAGRILIS